MQDLTRELEQIRNELNTSIKMLRKSGNKASEAERDYQIIKTQTAFKLEAEGKSASFINMVIKGMPEVAEKMYERDVALVLYETNKEHINVRKKDLAVVEAQIEREWHNG